MSLPSWECGLKSKGTKMVMQSAVVTPFVGVWIEIWKSPHNTAPPLVTPFVGVWIEIKRKHTSFT